MRISKLMVAPFEFQTIIAMESVIRPNEHGYAKITGYANEQQKNKIMSAFEEDVWTTIQGQDESGGGSILFCGLATDVQIENENDTYQVTVELKTGTFLMDLKEHIRIFQGNITHGRVQKMLLDTYADGMCLFAQSDMPTGEMYVQYHETDWEFAQRMASRKCTVLIPNEKSTGVKYTFGFGKDQEKELTSYDSFQMMKSVGNYQTKTQNGVTELEENDEISYIVHSRELLFVGDNISFEGNHYVIAEMRRVWDKKELWNSYTLKSLNGTAKTPYRNLKIIGASLKGYVDGVEKDKVEVSITEDENHGRGGSSLFPYATVYSSPDGTGWYCMPEEKDCILLHFPDEIESHAYVCSSVNLQSTDENARSDPDRKSIKNKYGQEIFFTPNSLVLTNNNGMSITIDDKQGIVLQSDKDIILNAADTIRISSEENQLLMSAAEKLLMQQSETSLELSDEVYLSGTRVNIQ